MRSYLTWQALKRCLATPLTTSRLWFRAVTLTIIDRRQTLPIVKKEAVLPGLGTLRL